MWKVWLSESTEELSDNEQEDVVDPAAADVYGPVWWVRLVRVGIDSQLSSNLAF